MRASGDEHKLNINLKLFQMCICDKQRYSFNRIYKYERS